MKKYFFLFVLCFLSGSILFAQKPYTWAFKATKISGNVYEIHLRADVQSPWHAYSQFTPEGGPVPTKFVFAKNPLYSLDGAVKENGKMITRHETVFGVDVQYFEGAVDFVQRIKLKGTAKTNFSGTVEFMVCNDEQCLPPTTEKFSVALN